MQVELPPMREYQEVDTGLLVKRRRNIIGHIMGLGKTRIAIECCYRTQVQRILVVVPNKLKRNFAREIRKWYPEAPVTIAAGSLEHKMFAITTFDVGFLI